MCRTCHRTVVSPLPVAAAMSQTVFAANDDGDELGRRRLKLRLGYGFGAFGDRFTSRPEAGFGMSDTGRDYGLVWRLVRDRRRGDLGSLEFALDARRRESANDNVEPEHGIGFPMRWSSSGRALHPTYWYPEQADTVWLLPLSTK